MARGSRCAESGGALSKVLTQPPPHRSIMSSGDACCALSRWLVSCNVAAYIRASGFPMPRDGDALDPTICRRIAILVAALSPHMSVARVSHRIHF